MKPYSHDTKPPLEKEIEAAVGRFAKAKACTYMKFTSPARRSVPDRIIIAPGHPAVIGFLELKRKGQKPTKAQELEMKKLKDAGCNVTWVDNVRDGEAFIVELMRKAEGGAEI